MISAETEAQHRQLLAGYEDSLRKLKSIEKQIGADLPLDRWRRIRREIAYNENAAFLHKMYFGDCFDSDPSPPEGTLLEYINKDYEEKEFWDRARKTAEGSRNGWMLIVYCVPGDDLLIEQIDLHDNGGTFHRLPIAALDMWEHSYVADFGLDKQAYFDWWFEKMNWSAVSQRLDALRKVHQEEI